MTSIALIVAAGSGTRSGLGFPKQYLKLGQQTVLEKSIRAFLDHDGVDHVLVVINPDDTELYNDAVKGLDIFPPVFGGATRQESVFNGLKALTEYQPNKVLIHDAARPFVDKSLISSCLKALEDNDAVLPALPLIDTIKSVEGLVVTGTIDRTTLVAAQTPQCFNFEAIYNAHQKFSDQSVTDDIALAEIAGFTVTWIAGSLENIKITTADDIKALTMKTLTDVRTGLGYDVHAFDKNCDLWLGGVQIPHEKGLKGHSDADVALHAITDALLGAIGDGDIGLHFPPNDPKWKGASSDQFLAHAANRLREKEGIIANIDLTIICEAPKISPYRSKMREKISEILDISIDRVSVKGTTTEKLGFTGRKEGIAAQAVATVRLPE